MRSEVRDKKWRIGGKNQVWILGGGDSWVTAFFPHMCPAAIYPYRIFPANSPLFSPDLRSHRLVSPIRLSVLGRTYGTYLHYERSYSINVFFIRNIGESRLRFDLRAKTSDSREISPQFPGKFPRDSGEISPRFRGNFPGHSREISRGIFEGKMIECAYRFNAPHAVMMVHTATPVLHDVRTRFLAPCHGRQPAESGGHFP